MLSFGKKTFVKNNKKVKYHQEYQENKTPEEACCHSISCKRPSVNSGVKIYKLNGRNSNIRYVSTVKRELELCVFLFQMRKELKRKNPSIESEKLLKNLKEKEN